MSILGTMANPNPPLSNLVKGRGKRPPSGRKSYTVKLTGPEKSNLDEIALSYGCRHGDGASISSLLVKIASEDLLVVPAPPSYKADYALPSPDSVVKARIDRLSASSLGEGLSRKSYNVKLTHQEKEKLDKISLSYGCKHGDGASISSFLSQIASERLLSVKMPPLRKAGVSLPDPSAVIRAYVSKINSANLSK